MNHLVAPSMLSADFLNLAKDIEMVNKSEADWFHLDVMDGVFVPNISFGFPIIEKIRKIANKPLDIHLMIVDPDRYLERFIKSGAFLLSVHYEACIHLHRTIHAIHDLGAKAGVVLNPHTSVNLLENIIKDVDLVLIMSVNPGHAGQQFMPEVLPKLARLKEIFKGDIAIDGGINAQTAPLAVTAGARVLITASYLFGADNFSDVVKRLKTLA